ncbi:hypothetical protein SARC_00431 [Sphaeroforma arctica JP610]|uniref:Uncharacterized protein n=1 Tax=Sphaeroforma arctica JP610 TaxID=667725 RepID=A0A0L0GEZ5_9EUKA|nr:hypothetical protein SARC_00431 [Sphaeroforma arctica JP610]KNC87449.1 hypothetical protein SARC_00431 [Sphaeroforma arctica JP610]|eukprot:XP_014161351.1 hypothetical protein SARC_00431 [Sphaeroforma arctica JP610]
MSDSRQSRRQQHVNPERRKEDDIDRRGTKRRQPNPDHINQQPEKDPDEHNQVNQGFLDPSNGLSSFVFGEFRLIVLRLAVIFRPAVSNTASTYPGGNSKPSNSQPCLPSGKRRRHHRRNNKGNVLDQYSAQKLTQLMAQQRPLPDKYEQRLQRTSPVRPIPTTETNNSSRKRGRPVSNPRPHSATSWNRV